MFNVFPSGQRSPNDDKTGLWWTALGGASKNSWGLGREIFEHIKIKSKLAVKFMYILSGIAVTYTLSRLVVARVVEKKCLSSKQKTKTKKQTKCTWGCSSNRVVIDWMIDWVMLFLQNILNTLTLKFWGSKLNFSQHFLPP